MPEEKSPMDHERLARELRDLTGQLNTLREALASLKVSIDHHDGAEEFVKKIREDLGREG